jgi:hypothetical protein
MVYELEILCNELFFWAISMLALMKCRAILSHATMLHVFDILSAIVR